MSETMVKQSTPETTKQPEAAVSAFSLEQRDDGIAVIRLDVPGEKMNTLRADFADSFHELLTQLRKTPELKGAVLISGKPDNFVAGADISMLAACHSAEQASEIGRQGQQLFSEIEALPFPVVAAIHGPALGGGLELAMACHARICTDWAKTQLGLPEVQLGLLPGSGGTQRLPRLVGLAKALDMMLTGKSLRPKQAKRAGLIDEVVPHSILLEAAVALAKRGIGKRAKPKGLQARLLEQNPLGRKVLFDQVKKRTLAKTQGHYPAPERIIECVMIGVQQGREAGFAIEASHFGELVMSETSRQLRSIFFATTEMKKERGADAEPRPLSKIGVLGGGLMGGGIAYVTASKAGLPVRIKDIAQPGISNALQYSYKQGRKKVKRRFMTPRELDKQLALLTSATDWQGFKQADMVVEAVFEDLDLKHEMVRQVEANCKPDTIFATNTSSLPITRIAEAAERPENVIGVHYFSPVEKMPLVEVITHDRVAPETIATAVAFARRQGKTPIVVKDGAGFYVNRILAVYMNEAAHILSEGGDVAQIDKVLAKFGFPVGPFKLLDEVGIDVGSKIAPIMAEAFGDRMAVPPLFDKLHADERKGRKNGKGFYQYGGKQPGKAVDESIYNLLNITPKVADSTTAITERCTLLMLNEAVRCLEEGIIASARDGDIGAIFGIGFPPFLGGPFRYLDTLEAKTVVEKLRGYQAEHGARFEPADLLVAMAEDGRKFHGEE